MKNTLLIFFAALMLPVSVHAQTSSFGARLGVNTIEASFQSGLSESVFFEADLGFDTYSGETGIIAEALMNCSILQPSFTSSGDWDIYAGLGIAAGYVYDNSLSTFTYRHPYYGTRETLYDRWGKGPMAGAAVQIGISYAFDEWPVKISIDARPILGLHLAERIHPDSSKNGRLGLYGAGIRCCYPRLSVYYMF